MSGSQYWTILKDLRIVKMKHAIFFQGSDREVDSIRRKMNALETELDGVSISCFIEFMNYLII